MMIQGSLDLREGKLRRVGSEGNLGLGSPCVWLHVPCPWPSTCRAPARFHCPRPIRQVRPRGKSNYDRCRAVVKPYASNVGLRCCEALIVHLHSMIVMLTRPSPRPDRTPRSVPPAAASRSQCCRPRRQPRALHRPPSRRTRLGPLSPAPGRQNKPEPKRSSTVSRHTAGL